MQDEAKVAYQPHKLGGVGSSPIPATIIRDEASVV